MLIGFVYLFVGVVHWVSCIEQGPAFSFAAQTVSSGSHDGDQPAELTLCDHCPSCTPALMPAPVTEATPDALPGSAPVALALLSAFDHRVTETPPPRTAT